mgnify:CR=1 FL=1
MKIKIDKTMPTRRNVEAYSLINFRSSTIPRRGAPRGGASNNFGEFLDEVVEAMEVQNELDQLGDEDLL